MKPKFWMVLSESGGPPRYRHGTEAAARIEAERLARTHGGTFHILECKASCTRNDVDWQEHSRPQCSQPEPRFDRSPLASLFDEVMAKSLDDSILNGSPFSMIGRPGRIR